MSTTKIVFHGSDIEKICEVYHLKQENIVKFGANVNPLGLSENVKKQLASHLDILSSYPDRDYTSLRNLRLLQRPCQFHPSRKRIQRADRTSDPGKKSETHSNPRTYLLRIFQRTFLLRKHPGILPPSRGG